LSTIAALVVAGLVWRLPPVRPDGILWRVGAYLAPGWTKILRFIHPVFNPLAKLVPRPNVAVHIGIYEKEDLLELLDHQRHSVDNRIPEEELKIAASALSFGDKLVAKVMVPRRVVRFVSEEEVLGPALLDELHKTGLSRFPVVKGPAKSASPKVVGALYLRDVVEIGQENKGLVRDHMKKNVYFINEACTLRQALDAILKSRHHLLIVVNNFEEMVGVIALEDIIEQIMGQKIVDEFDKYDDLRAVANIEAERERAAHHEIEAPEPAGSDESEPPN